MVFIFQDGEGVDIQIGVCAGGIMIYKDKLQISRFVWPKVVKMSYRRNKFYIKLRPGEVGEWASDLRQSIVYTESCHQ